MELISTFEELYCILIDSEQLDFDEVIKYKRWIFVIDEEIKSIVNNIIWEIETLPKGHKFMKVQDKNHYNREVEEYKPRLIAESIYLPLISSTYL